MVKAISIFVVVMISISLISLEVYAEEDFSDEYEELTEGIPDDIAELLPDEIFSGDEETVISGVKKLTSWEFIIDTLFEMLGLNPKQIVYVLASLLSMLVICSLLHMIKNIISNNGLAYVLDLVGCAAVGGTIISLSKPMLEKTLLLCGEIQVFVNTMSPFICGMYAMGGNVTTAVVQNYGLIVFLSIFENVCTLILQVVLGVSMALVVASIFIGNDSLLSLNNALKNGFTFFLGFIMLIYTTVISTQTLLSSKADSLSSKTVKMLTSQIIPVIGGSVGDSLKTAGASIEYLRSNIGILLIIVFVLMVLPTIISICLYRLVFILANGAAGLLGCEKEGRVMLEISSIYGHALAIISICAISLLFLLTTFAKCASPLA